MATEPPWQHKGANETQSQVRRHPKLVTRATLASVVAGRQEKSEFANSVGNNGGKTDANKPLELVVIHVCDQRVPHDKNDGDSKDRNGKQDGVETESSVHEARESLSCSHLPDLVTPKAELELEGGVDSSDGPTSSLLEMPTIVFRDGAELERLMDEGSPPASAKKHGRGGDIFGK